MIILRLLLLLTNLHLKLLSTQGIGADKLLSTQRVKLSKYCDIDAHRHKIRFQSKLKMQGFFEEWSVLFIKLLSLN